MWTSSKPFTRIASAVVLLTGLTACGLTAPRSNEGYADLDSLK